jgi:hypothetical protein
MGTAPPSCGPGLEETQLSVQADPGQEAAVEFRVGATADPNPGLARRIRRRVRPAEIR